MVKLASLSSSLGFEGNKVHLLRKNKAQMPAADRGVVPEGVYKFGRMQEARMQEQRIRGENTQRALLDK